MGMSLAVPLGRRGRRLAVEGACAMPAEGRCCLPGYIDTTTPKDDAPITHGFYYYDAAHNQE